MNAIELLKADHEVVESLFDKVEGSGPYQHPELFEKIRADLEAQAYIEESNFTLLFRETETKHWLI